MLSALLCLALGAAPQAPRLAEPAPAWTPGPPPSAAALAVLARHECNRCHEVEGVAAPTTEASCAGCHRDLAAAGLDPARVKAGAARYGEEAFSRFVRRTSRRYVAVPPLVAMGRLRADWLRAFLRAPYDVRPNLEESMIRHALSDAEVEALVSGWGAREGEDPRATVDASRLELGALVFEEHGCATCHLFGNRRFVAAGDMAFALTPELRARAAAPDLRHVRHRLSREALLAVLADPKAVNPAAQMPAPELTYAEQKLLADFILYGEPGVPWVGPPAAAPPAAPEPVTYAQVEREVFKKICWHCHSSPKKRTDGGPGNTGGFGFAKSGLSFATYADVLRGSLDAHGRPQSIFRPAENGEPVLLMRLRARRHENARDFLRPGQDDLRDRRADAVDGPRGMPLGLPALDDAQLRLVERWVEAGMPGP